MTNAGAGATPNYTWNDALYLSPTATFDPTTAIALGSQTHQGSLDAGGAYTNTVTRAAPQRLTGPSYIVVDTDSGNAVFELNKTNNLAVSTSAVQVSQAPADLVVSSASARRTLYPAPQSWSTGPLPTTARATAASARGWTMSMSIRAPRGTATQSWSARSNTTAFWRAADRTTSRNWLRCRLISRRGITTSSWSPTRRAMFMKATRATTRPGCADHP